MTTGSEACQSHPGGSDGHASNVVFVMLLCCVILVVLVMFIEAA